MLINERLAQCEAELRRSSAPSGCGATGGRGSALVRRLNGEFEEALLMLHTLDGVSPTLPEDGEFWIAPGARLIGNVVLEAAPRSGSTPCCAATTT